MDQVESLSLTFNEAIEAIKQNRKKLNRESDSVVILGMG